VRLDELHIRNMSIIAHMDHETLWTPWPCARSAPAARQAAHAHRLVRRVTTKGRQ
jgi:hypothetical protein